MLSVYRRRVSWHLDAQVPARRNRARLLHEVLLSPVRDLQVRRRMRDRRRLPMSGTTCSGGPQLHLANQLHLSSSTRRVAVLVVQYGVMMSPDHSVTISAFRVAYLVLLHLGHHMLQQRALPARACPPSVCRVEGVAGRVDARTCWRELVAGGLTRERGVAAARNHQSPDTASLPPLSSPRPP